MNKTGKNLLTVFLIIFLSIVIINELVDEAKKEMKDNKDYSLIKTEKYDLTDIKDIDIDMVNNIEVLESDDDQMKIEQYSKHNNPYKDSVSNSKIEINHDGISEDCFFFFVCFGDSSNLKVYLPRNYNKKLTLSSVSGDITFKDLKSNNTEITSTSGNISGNSILSNESLIKTISGDIKINSVESNEVTLKSVSGRIDNDILKGKFEAQTTSGEITLNDTTVKGESLVKSVSGDLDVTINDDSNCKISTKTTSGNTKQEKSTYGNGEYEIYLKTVSGNIKVN